MLERGRTEHLDEWANAHLALAFWLTTKGDDAGAARAIREMEDHLAALALSQVLNWSAHARQVLAAVKRFPS